MTRSISQEMGHTHEDIKPIIQDDIAEVEEEEEPDVEESKVETTAEELEAFEKVKAIAATSKLHQLEVKYRDVVSYFGVNAGKTTWWFLRFYLSPKRKSFVTRLSVDDVKTLAPDFEVQEMSASLGDAASRVVISSVDDLDKLSTLILKCYEVEAAKH
jgi:predicted type IV restriction endonuclease